MDKAGKKQEVEFIGEHLKSSVLALCADYRGLTVDEITQLRSSLTESGAFGRVVKNTLAKVSIDQALTDGEREQVEKFKELFTGPSFVVFAGEDPAGPAKVMTKFAKEHENLEIKGGWFEGTCLELDGVKALSDLPSRDELYAKLLSILSAPATKVVQLLQAPGSKLVQTLEAHRQKLESQE